MNSYLPIVLLYVCTIDSHADASVLLDEGISTYSGPTDVEDVKMTSGLVEASDDTTDLEFSIRQPRDHVIQAAGIVLHARV